MALTTFKLTCAHGHGVESFAGQDAVDHAETCLNNKLGTIGKAVQAYRKAEPTPYLGEGRIIWKPAGIRPFRWTAPRPGTGVPDAKLLKALEAAGATYEELT